MFCHNCGTKNKVDAKFCASCGTILRKPKSPVEKVVKSKPKAKVQPAKKVKSKPTTKKKAAEVQNEGQKTRKNNQRKKTSWWKWLIPLLIVLAGAGYVGYYFYTTYFQMTPISTSATNKAETKQSKDGGKKKIAKVEKPKLDFPKSTIEGTVDDAFGDMDGNTSVYVSPVDSDEKVVSNNGSQRSASNIKLFIMVVAYQQADEGQFNLDDEYTLKDSDKVGGTGSIREEATGSKITNQELLEYMMEESDNSAANIVISQLGGVDKVNDQIQKLDVADTKLERKMMDTAALNDDKDNYTSVEDMGMILKKIYNHKMVSKKYDDAMLDILKDNENHTKLPHDLPDDVTVYNKTGEYDDKYGVENDAAIFENKKGAFIIVVMSEDGDRAQQVDQMNSFGKVMYEGLLED